MNNNFYESEKYIGNQYILLKKYGLNEKQIKIFKRFLSQNFKTNKLKEEFLNDNNFDIFFEKEFNLDNIKDIHILQIKMINYCRYVDGNIFLFDYTKGIEKKYLDLIYDLFNSNEMKIMQSKDKMLFLTGGGSLIFTGLNI